MKYIVECEFKNRMTDTTLLETDSLDEAVKKLISYYRHLTYRERKDLEYLLVLESHNPDKETDDHLDGLVVFDITPHGINGRSCYRPMNEYADYWFSGVVGADYVEECMRYGIPTDDLVECINDWGVEAINELEEI